MGQPLDASAGGVYTISATPFTDSGDIDWPSVDSLIEFYLQCGVQGLTVLGMMGEAQKLSDQESAEFTQRPAEERRLSFPLRHNIAACRSARW